MLGEVRGLCDPDNRCAEFAIQVATGRQGRGLGRLLMQKLIAHLRARGTGEVVGECLAGNLRLEALARSLGFAVTPASSDGLLSLRLALSD